MKAVVIGGSGFIGQHLFGDLCGLFPTVLTTSDGRNNSLKLDLRTPAVFDYSIFAAGDIAYICAAISSPDICRQAPSLARAVNVDGTVDCIKRLLSQGVRVIFFSSDTVYGETSRDIDESYQGIAVGEYAIMKKEVEDHFLEEIAFKSIRLSYVFSQHDKFTTYLRDCAMSHNVADIYYPLDRAVIYLKDVLAGATELAKQWDFFPQRKINFGGPKIVSRPNFASILRENALPSLDFRSVDAPPDFFETRPRSIRMQSPVLQQLLGRPTYSLQDAVQLEFS